MNIGYLDMVVGLVGCIKVVMSLYYNEFVLIINCMELNLNINFESFFFYVVCEWKLLEKCVGVYWVVLSLFGFGGINVYVVFE